MEGTIGEIRGFAGNFNPMYWAICQGQTLQITQYTALFSIIGTYYGGNGQTTFMLPDLRGRIPVSAGQGTGLAINWSLGEYSGSEKTQLTIANLPTHNHPAATSSMTVTGTATGNITPSCCSEVGDKMSAVGNVLSSISSGYVIPGDADSNMAPISASLTVNGTVAGMVTIGNTGSAQLVSNIQPSLAINWIICLNGEFPSRD